MDPKSRSNRLSDLQLEKIALGEAAPPQPLSSEQAAQLEALRESNAQIVARYPAAPQAEQIAARLRDAEHARAQHGARDRAPIRMWLPVFASAAAVLSLIVWTTRDASQHGTDPTQGSGPSDTIVAKGTAPTSSVRAYRQGATQIEPLQSGATVRSGDLLQLALVPGKARHGVLFSIDGRGGVTLHFPAREGDSTQLTQASSPQSEHSEVRLPQAFRLDDAPGFERFFLLLVDEAHRDSLRVTEVLDKARRLAADPSRAQTGSVPDLPPFVEQTSLIVRKDAR